MRARRLIGGAAALDLVGAEPAQLSPRARPRRSRPHRRVRGGRLEPRGELQRRGLWRESPSPAAAPDESAEEVDVEPGCGAAHGRRVPLLLLARRRRRAERRGGRLVRLPASAAASAASSSRFCSPRGTHADRRRRRAGRARPRRRTPGDPLRPRRGARPPRDHRAGRSSSPSSRERRSVAATGAHAAAPRRPEGDRGSGLRRRPGEPVGNGGEAPEQVPHRGSLPRRCATSAYAACRRRRPRPRGKLTSRRQPQPRPAPGVRAAERRKHHHRLRRCSPEADE